MIAFGMDELLVGEYASRKDRRFDNDQVNLSHYCD